LKLFEGGERRIEQHKEAINATQQNTTKDSQLEKDLTGSGNLEILVHRGIIFGL